MKILLALAFLAVATPARADTCTPSGDPIFEIHALVQNSPASTITQLYGNGAWTVTVTTGDGKPGAGNSGCLPKDKLAKVRADLKAMPWKIRHNKIHCMAISPNYKVYKVAGKTMWESHLCGTDVVDDKTASLLADVSTVLDVK